MAHDAGRDDLARRLGGSRARIDDPAARVVVVGQLKQGKSHLINALLNVPVARVGDGETTSTITVVGTPNSRGAADRRKEPQPDDPDGAGAGIELPIDAVSRICPMHPKPAVPAWSAWRSGFRPLLARGLVVVDTPGTGGVGNPHASARSGCSRPRMRSSSPPMSARSTRPRRCRSSGRQMSCAATLSWWHQDRSVSDGREVVDADIAHLRKRAPI